MFRVYPEYSVMQEMTIGQRNNSKSNETREKGAWKLSFQLGIREESRKHVCSRKLDTYRCNAQKQTNTKEEIRHGYNIITNQRRN